MRLFELEWSWASKPLAQPWHSLLLAVFAIALLAASAHSYKSTRDFVRMAHRSNGVVVSINEDARGFYPRVRFVDSAGQRHEFYSPHRARPLHFSVGEQVAVLYLPNSPKDARIERFSELWSVPLITGMIGSCLTIAAVLLWIFRDRLFARV